MKHKTHLKLTDLKRVNQRKEFLEKELAINLKDIASVLIDDEKDVHCENLIGAISLPLGVAGPINIQGKYINGDYFLPLATSEGALVASVNRGCKVVNQSGGVLTNVEQVGTSRAPVFETSGIRQGLIIKKWLHENFHEIKKVTKSTSSHLELLDIKVQIIGVYVFVRFLFDSEDAMGMNMVTIATEKIIEFINKQTDTVNLSIAGNYEVDKKPAWLNMISGRGKRIWAESIIKNTQIIDTLKTTPQKIFDVWLAKCMIGSAISGSLGFNSHFANIVAAFYAATGQDLAHTVEGSLGVTTTKILSNQDLYFSVYLPDIMIGTIGGGTRLKTQAEAINIIGVKKSYELAEVLAAAVLAGELSLLASLAEGSLAKAHSKLGR
ncbi:hypothetical protein A3C23_01415 [Candidatus Roizmanbacteria bacterium RIFCSPHIGHO2_02_FULL_37_13b]|uniref:hydroxymethylglutaryl-CoA reductase (NADPH) n=1 Tax=Candidatus Roizmanbacteria bacterium RIFCSPLOWO2_02_FULL_36_11 TaxID=1802071 RepID=A0A1F7JC42_9BACT|nr:MAG: hypothetical protein A3C23_01415 [Candidatus Roizmanbacteria bacterium RIFCSPHIGHO2_02_FULL_37_13b]OGK53197.1 MAG: hypothetical protein A3H78_02575 [Candidatus Roizmanbacteria bacterium RIFCSPLOWO2_02_FULL_36_11]